MKDLKFYNTLTKTKEEFRPLDPHTVRMYHCGPTVYNFAHIGNLRSYIFADLIRRTVEESGFKVKQVINITDVGHLTDDGSDGEDKVEKQANKESKTAEELTEFYTQAFLDNIKELNVKTKDTQFPKATDYIKEEIELIKKLEEESCAYQTSDGVYFDTSKFENYGALGGIDLKGLKEGARVEAPEEKKSPTDFALWKFSPKNTKRQQEWESPWGVGFPGWHIECSAMSQKILGETFDIHTGGIDHIPVHHNNEIAQSECASGKTLSRFWMHNEHVLIEGKKMSKSLENLVTIRDLKERNVHPLSYRYWLLSGHYRTQINFTWEAITGAQEAFKNILYSVFLPTKETEDPDTPEKFADNLKKIIADDLDTPKALALLNKFAGLNLTADKKKGVFEVFDRLLGLNILPVVEKMLDVPEDMLEKSEERNKARAEKDWEKADKFREELENEGFEVVDLEKNTIVSRKLESLI